MKASFILESFDEYVSEVYLPLNEAKDPLSEKEAQDIIETLVLKQRRKALDMNAVKDLLKQVFGDSFVDSNIQKMRKNVRWADPKDIQDPEFFKKIEDFENKFINSKLMDKKDSNNSVEITGAIVMGLFFDWMAPATFKSLSQDLIKLSQEKNLGYKKIKSQIDEKPFQVDTLNQPPAILAYTEAGEIEKEIPEKKLPPREISLLSDASQKTLFKNNSWELDPKVSLELKEKLKAVFERRKAGGFSKILEFSIQSSASRYRNRGQAENLSWGQLSFKRSQVVYEMVKTVLQELEISEGDPIREELNSIFKLDIGGSNGDGTSGPNPMKDPELGFLRVGYYETVTPQNKTNTGSSKFIDKDKNKPQEVYITKIDSFGNPEGSPTMKTMKLEDNVEDYDKYRFVNVIVKVQETSMVPGKVESAKVTKVPNNTLAPEIILNKKGTQGGGGGWNFKFELPKLPRLIPIGLGSINPIKGDCFDSF